MGELTLCIDVSSFSPSVAISKGGEIVAQEVAGEDYSGAENLLRLVGNLLQKYTSSSESLKGICVGVGPGSFTGVRTAIATAQGLSTGWGLPLSGMSILHAAVLCKLNSQSFCLDGEECLFVPHTKANKLEEFIAVIRYNRSLVTLSDNQRQAALEQIVECAAVSLDKLEESVELIISEVIPSREPGRATPRVVIFDIDTLFAEEGLCRASALGKAFFMGANYQGLEVSQFDPLREPAQAFKMLTPLYGKGVQAKTLAERKAAARIT